MSGSFSNDSRLKSLFKVNKVNTNMANARLNLLALAYIHKPTEIDSSPVLKRWDAFGHRRIALAFTKDGQKIFTFVFMKVTDFLVLQV